MSRIGETLCAYKEANGVSRAEMARSIGLKERRLRTIMNEGGYPSEDERAIIMDWLRAEHFDYIPPEKVVQTTQPKPKDGKRKTLKETDAMGIKGDAKALVRAYKEAKGFKTDTDALTHIVNTFFRDLLKEGK